MTSVFFDSPLDDESRRARLFSGDIFVYTAVPGSAGLADLARELLEEAFAPWDPREAQHHLPVDRYAEILGRVKPSFIHHPRAKQLLIEMLSALGCDPDRTYFDVPKMRSSTSDDYLTTGIAYAFHPHRDTWYGGPPCQINWWLPVYPITAENGMVFYPDWFGREVPNDSARFDYYEWNSARHAAAGMIGQEARFHPRPNADVDLGTEIRVVTPVGGVTVFAADAFHGSLPNHSGVTRFSIDLRSVHVDDALAGRGAPCVDARCRGTAGRDFLRCRDLEHLPEQVIARWDDPEAAAVAAELVYTPDT
jgi:hypothetical protein